jgi:hypothetical protein
MRRAGARVEEQGVKAGYEGRRYQGVWRHRRGEVEPQAERPPALQRPVMSLCSPLIGGLGQRLGCRWWRWGDRREVWVLCCLHPWKVTGQCKESLTCRPPAGCGWNQKGMVEGQRLSNCCLVRLGWSPGKPGAGQVQSTCPAEHGHCGGGDVLPIHSVHHPLG